jgi:hypothetical protein
MPTKKAFEVYAEELLDMFSDVAMNEHDIAAIAFYTVSHARHPEVVRRIREYGRALDAALETQLGHNGLDGAEKARAMRLDPPIGL